MSEYYKDLLKYCTGLKDDEVALYSNNPYRSSYYSEFGSFWVSRFKEDGVTFSCLEQYIVYHKAMLFNLNDVARKVLLTSNRDNLRFISNMINKNKNFKFSLWYRKREELVMNGNLLKFSQNKSLCEKLKSCKGKVIVNAMLDATWGTGLTIEDYRNLFPKEWYGSNLSGFCLMDVRDKMFNW